MSREADVARVTAAINTPGLRYRSFGNALPRPSSIPAAEADLPMAEEPAVAAPASDSVPDSAPATAPEPIALPPAAPAPAMPAPMMVEPEADLPFAGRQEAPPAVAAPEPEPEPAPVEPPAPPIDWAALAAQPVAAPAPLPTPMLPLPPTPAEPLDLSPQPPAYRLLEAIGHAPSPAPTPAAPPSGGTLAMLQTSAPAGGDIAAMPLLNPVPAPTRGFDPAPGHLPAQAVTVPLAEVMRLVASGAAPAASPFDAFRAALRPRGAN